MDIIDRLNKCRRSLKTWNAVYCSRPIVVASTALAPRDVGLRLARLQPRDGLSPLMGR
jgi:hypothetical protein